MSKTTLYQIKEKVKEEEFYFNPSYSESVKKT